MAFAGGALTISDSGDPAAWNNTTTIVYHTEDGTCGNYSNTEILAKIETDLGVWEDVEEAEISFGQVTGILGQVNVDNYADYFYLGTGSDDALAEDDINPVIFDDDAEIIYELAGDGNEYVVLGITAVVGYSSDYSEITDAEVIINCRCLEDHPSGPCYEGSTLIEYTESDLDFTLAHEMGHFINLDHSQVNINYYGDGDDDNDEDIPIMFPISISVLSSFAARTDDKIALATIYPSSTFDDEKCLVTGTLVDTEGDEVRCVDVWAEAADPADTVSQVSGAFAIAEDDNDDGDTVDSGECTSGCGYFQLYLEPGADYELNIYDINSLFVGGSSVGPCINSQLALGFDGDSIANVSSSQCVAGTTVSLGEINLGVDVTAADYGDDSGDDDDDGDDDGGAGAGGASGYDDDLNPVGYGCALQSLVARRPPALFELRRVNWSLVSDLWFVVFGLFVFVRMNTRSTL